MTSLSCCIHLSTTTTTTSSTTPPKLNLRNGFVGLNGSGFRPIINKLTLVCPTNGGKAMCWFKFGKNGVDAEGAGIYGNQSRDDFDRDDVEQYFNYMGMLAVEGTYDKMEALLNQNIHPVDILLLMAASEGDKPKIEELLRAGASYEVKDAEGRTALDRAADDIKDFILNFTAQKA